jgi:NADPH-dependent 2,4-dienoyl-CoA reductase/sulfur reductase-like enzyme
VGTVVVIGTGPAGVRAAAALRRAGWAGRLVLVGAEPVPPYDRPSLSKDVLLGSVAEPPPLRLPAVLGDVEWRVGCRVVRADLAAQRVLLDDGEVLAWDGLVLAPGLTARRLPGDGALVVHAAADLPAAQSALAPGRAVTVVGAGVLGCELALAAAHRGCAVTVVAPEPMPHAALGPLVGGLVAEVLVEAGVTLMLGTAAVRADARVVELADGRRVDADATLVAVGAVPSLGWVDAPGLEVAAGLPVDPWLRLVDGSPREDVVAAGDAARVPLVLGGRPLAPSRVEHWRWAQDTGDAAGASLAAGLGARPRAPEPPVLVPSAWTDLHGRGGTWTLQTLGVPGAGSSATLLEGDPAARELVVGYHADGALVGVALLGFAARARHYRTLLAARPPEVAGGPP